MHFSLIRQPGFNFNLCTLNIIYVCLRLIFLFYPQPSYCLSSLFLCIPSFLTSPKSNALSFFSQLSMHHLVFQALSSVGMKSRVNNSKFSKSQFFPPNQPDDDLVNGDVHVLLSPHSDLSVGCQWAMQQQPKLKADAQKIQATRFHPACLSMSSSSISQDLPLSENHFQCSVAHFSFIFFVPNSFFF